MFVFNGKVTLPSGSPRTLQEMVRAAIMARTYSSTTVRTEAANRIAGIIREGFVKPTADIYSIDAYKGVRNGEAIASDWTAGDFTGGGELLSASESKHFNNGADMGNRVYYQATGASVDIYVDITVG